MGLSQAQQLIVRTLAPIKHLGYFSAYPNVNMVFRRCMRGVDASYSKTMAAVWCKNGFCAATGEEGV